MLPNIPDKIMEHTKDVLEMGGFKPNMLPVPPQNMSLDGYNQMFMISRIVSSDDKILCKKSSDLGHITKNGPSNWIIFLHQGKVLIQIC